MSIRLKKYSYRFAEQVFNGKIQVKNELEDIIYSATKDLSILSRPEFNKILNSEFEKRGWETQPPVFDKEDDAYAKFDFLKDYCEVVYLPRTPDVSSTQTKEYLKKN